MNRKTRESSSEKREADSSERGDRSVSEEQPPPRLGVFSGGDPTLAERFEEELYKRKDD